MCGFTGFILRAPWPETEGRSVVSRMGAAIKHRGPDGQGQWVDCAAKYAVAHARLAVLDLTETGAQPMFSVSGRFVLAFNGEIYNHRQLRKRLDASDSGAVAWRGGSDTETLLACIEAWGLEKTLKASVGMFALALWDRSERLLMLARDRFGEKPLYYGWVGSGSKATFLFGSELSALRKHPCFDSEIDRETLASYLQHNCVGGERSIYCGIHKLGPGCILILPNEGDTPRLQSWWSSERMIQAQVASRYKGTVEEAIDHLDGLLREAVSQQMISDVPIGAFLSGGIDSSTVVALMQTLSNRRVSTFSIGFHEQAYDEAPYARSVASCLGTDHHELYVTANQALDVISELPGLYSEPFADSSQIPTFLVSQLARQHVTVSLSGDAGDELFCGYNRYETTAKFWSMIKRTPLPVRRLLANVLTGVSPESWDKLQNLTGVRRLGDRVHKVAGVLSSTSVEQLYTGLVSHWMPQDKVVIGAASEQWETIFSSPALKGLSAVERMMAADLLAYLPDDILAKVDRAAMAVSLETRVPFLDHRVASFAWSLPQSYKLHNGVTKWPLREVLNRYVPKSLFERPKAGFGVPLDRWLRGPLKDWAETLLSEHRLRAEGFFAPQPIRQKWHEHLSGKRNWQYHLWDVLMFQAWLEHQRV